MRVHVWMTSDRLTAIERAFELAKSGDCANVAELRKQLRSEGYPEYHLVGPSLSRQLRDLCMASRREPEAEALAGEEIPKTS